jgi:hypothetical protein
MLRCISGKLCSEVGNCRCNNCRAQMVLTEKTGMVNCVVQKIEVVQECVHSVGYVVNGVLCLHLVQW